MCLAVFEIDRYCVIAGSTFGSLGSERSDRADAVVPMQTKQSYRSLERQCREQAALSSTPATKRELERMAEEYADLAAWQEQQWPQDEPAPEEE
jgi:hypothetical protein